MFDKARPVTVLKVDVLLDHGASLRFVLLSAL